RALLGSGRTAGSTAHRAKRAVPRGRYGSLTAAARSQSRTGPPTVAGRWSLLPEREPDPTVRAHALARTLLDRHGVVTRGAVAAEGVEGGFSAVYRILSAFEETGQARRGYVVEGLGAAQFAMDGAVDRLRAAANARDRGEALPAEGFSSPFPAADPGFQPDFTGSRGAPDFGSEFPAETGRGPAVPTVDGSDSRSSPADFGTPPGAGFLDGSGAASDFRLPGDGDGTSDDFPFPGDFGSRNGSDPFATIALGVLVLKERMRPAQWGRRRHRPRRTWV
ncbi:hypothetical protein ABZS63_26525, partial [Streptomyces sp. NPDC005568]